MNKNYWEDLDEISNNNTPRLINLPITHNTTFDRFLNVLRDGAFLPTHEDVNFKIKLLFFYYGIPLFPIKENRHRACIFTFEVSEDFYSHFNWSPIDTGSFKKILEKSALSTGFDSHVDNYETFKKEYLLLKRSLLNEDTRKYKSIIELEKHIKFFFGDEENYVSGNTLEKLPVTDYESDLIRKIHRTYKAVEAQNYMKTSFFEDTETTYMDSRVKIIEGHTKLSVKLIDEVELVFCHVPKSKSKMIQDIFGINEENISTYQSSLSGNHTDNIVLGFDEYKKFLSKKYASLQF